MGVTLDHLASNLSVHRNYVGVMCQSTHLGLCLKENCSDVQRNDAPSILMKAVGTHFEEL